jgi:hypothetical protein
MKTVEDIEKAIAQLAPADLDRFRAWYEAFDARRFDERIERDARAGKLDRNGGRSARGTPCRPHPCAGEGAAG